MDIFKYIQQKITYINLNWQETASYTLSYTGRHRLSCNFINFENLVQVIQVNEINSFPFLFPTNPPSHNFCIASSFVALSKAISHIALNAAFLSATISPLLILNSISLIISSLGRPLTKTTYLNPGNFFSYKSFNCRNLTFSFSVALCNEDCSCWECSLRVRIFFGDAPRRGCAPII